MKNLLNSVMLFLLLFVAQNAWCTIVAGGDLTTTISWRVEKISGVSKLTVYGTGEMPDYSSNTAVPWAEYRNAVSVLEIGDGITKIGSRAFNGIGTTKVSIPSSCKTIGMLAFNGCRKMTAIYIPASVTSISTNAVNNCPKLKFVHYDGRCTSSTAISLATCAETGRFIEKSGTGDSYADVPEGWEYYTHAEKCQGGAWVAENADQTKLFFYAQSSGATVDYASTVVLSEDDQDATNHPWRLNCYKYTSLEIDKNIAAIGEDELRGYVNRDVTKMGYINMQTITVQSGNSYFVVGEDGALYDKSKTTVYLYPAKSTATNIEIPATVTTIRPGAFYGAENLQKIDFLGTISTIGTYAFAQTSSLSYLGFASETAPTSTATTAFTGVARGGVVATSVETNAFKTFTSNIGYGWTFAGETLGPVKSYISNGTLYVVGKGQYATSSSNASWYSQRSSIKKIVVKGGITDIGGEAFADCSNVTEATLNNSGTVGYYAFKDCSALNRIGIGSGVTKFEYYTLGNFDCYPFSGCSKLATINVTDLKAFCSISGLQYLTGSYGTAETKTLMVNGVALSSTSELVIPEGVTSISQYAFRYFSNVTKIRLPKSMKTISGENFSDHIYLTEITVPSTVSSVGERAFVGCTSLQTATLNNGGNIGDEAFKGCTALKTAFLNNDGYIGGRAFEGCTTLQAVELNNSGYVGYYAFKDCSALSRIGIGSGVTKFEDYTPGNFDCYPFEGCSKLATINVTDLAKYCSIEGLKYLTDSSYGTAETKTLMVNGYVHSSTSELVIPEGVTSISQYAFRYFPNVTKIRLPKSMKTIDNGDFSDHIYLTEITVPSTVSSVGERAFKGCIALKTATLNNDGPIFHSAFEGCTSLLTATLNNHGYIGYDAFKDCSALTRVNIGSGVTGFNNFGFAYPFSGCSKLTIINVTDLAKYCSIEDLNYLTDSYYGTAESKTLMVNGVALSSTSELDIPEGVTTIEGCAFCGFTNLTKVKIPSTVTSVTFGAFCKCPNLKRIVCLAPTCPSSSGSIASNPENITLRVRGGTASQYKADSRWKDFNIEEYRYEVQELNMYANEGKDLYTDVKALSWTSSDTDVATVNKLNDVSGRVNTKDFVCDGTISTPYKTVTITADLGDYDTYIWKIRVEPNECVLTDGNAYKLAKDYEAKKVSYTRTFSEKVKNHWQCFYVPFDIEVTDELLQDFDFAKLYMVSYQDANGNGFIEDGEPLRMTFNKFSAGRILHANMPYYVKAKSACTKTFEATNAVLKAAANGSVNCSTTEHEYSLVGIYETTNVKGWYTMNTQGQFVYCKAETNIKANRWYMAVTSRTGSGADLENYARPIEIYVEGEEETTGIVALEDKASESKNDKVFTLDGRQVTNTDNLPSGIYIINGKKVFKK